MTAYVLGLFEDLAVILGFFAATTALAVAYASAKSVKPVVTKPGRQVVVLQASDLPEQVDTGLSRVVLEAEEKVRLAEEKALKLLERFEGGGDGRSEAGGG
ncbi:MAG: hypothetical protein QXR26_02305 [Candidatus Caldarchaeum sp.]